MLDFVAFVLLVILAIASGSLTMLAEVPRGGLLYAIEIVSLITLRRSHRGQLSSFEYGIGKIERVISILIGVGLYVAALYTFSAIIERIHNPSILPTAAMMFAVGFASFNLLVNLYCLGEFVRSIQTESSLILEFQIRSRVVKVFASAVVVVVLVIAIWLPDPKAALFVDAAGALFVVVYMISTATQLMRESLPDVLDRALPERDQLLLLRAITQHFEHFDQFDAIKSRRSGGKAFIDVDLKFDPEMPLKEVTRRCNAIDQSISDLIPDAIVSVVPRVVV